ncbi:hypothetical protein AVEN_183366-1 [Araneus ventricosus]|uniref:Uncharacterized protein n=1 Tax=Araneus ventricosus TaxID=182803 RepID=A0A4Y2WZJ1_ARAVE|nr:hypothetical protein AVEN_183366-1 [Araneus ventricosus]
MRSSFRRPRQSDPRVPALRLRRRTERKPHQNESGRQRSQNRTDERLPPVRPQPPRWQPPAHGRGHRAQAHHPPVEALGSVDHVVCRVGHGHGGRIPVHQGKIGFPVHLLAKESFASVRATVIFAITRRSYGTIST